MSAIKGVNTKPELLVRSYLRSNGVKYRCNVKSLPGSPDIAIKKYKLALDVHGCFWHGHTNCKHFRLPKSNTLFWDEKIGKNISRDLRTKKQLEALGFQYFVIWECEVKEIKMSKAKNFVKLYFMRRGIDQ